MRKFNKLFVVSLPRCATVSMCKALKRCGLRIAHLGKVMEDPANGPLAEKHFDIDELEKLLAEIKQGCYRFSLLERCEGLADYPACTFQILEHLAHEYPESLYINVRRDHSLAKWMQSIERQFVGRELLSRGDSDPVRQRLNHALREFRQMTFGQSNFDALRYEQAYRTYQAKLSAFFGEKNESLLQFSDTTELQQFGYARLCKFIQIPQICEEFPRSNSHSNPTATAFMSALSRGEIVSQTGILPESDAR